MRNAASHGYRDRKLLSFMVLASFEVKALTAKSTKDAKRQRSRGFELFQDDFAGGFIASPGSLSQLYELNLRRYSRIAR